MKKPFQPELKTNLADYSREELNKRSRGQTGTLVEDFRSEKPDLAWESEQLAKSQGIYLEFNRARTGTEKDWMYMVRFSIPGGGPLSREQWRLFDALADAYAGDPQGRPSLRLTTRQNIQFHWIKKPAVIPLIKSLAEAGVMSLNGCGDNTRNMMACPLGRFSPVYDGSSWALKAAQHFQLPLEPFLKIFAIDTSLIRKPETSFSYGPGLLNRKFKMAFAGVHWEEGRFIPDNCVEALTNDLAVVPVIRGGRVDRFQVYIGGGQGERNGHATGALLAQPMCQVDETRLLPVLDAIVAVHQEWGDRKNRFWARLKYVVKLQGVDWFRERVEERLGFPLDQPDLGFDLGARHLHHGWHLQPLDGLWARGVFIENGRLTDDSPNGRLKTMVKSVMEKFPLSVMITPNQDLMLTHIPADMKDAVDQELSSHGQGLRGGKPHSTLRLRSGACVGLDTCRLAYTDSEKFEPELIDELERRGWGDMKESIGVTGCERQCFRPATKTLGWVGTGSDLYMLKLFGDEGGRHQGGPLISPDGEKIYLRTVPREKVADVVEALFLYHQEQAQPNEDVGAFLRRQGPAAIIERLTSHPATAPLMSRTAPADGVMV